MARRYSAWRAIVIAWQAFSYTLGPKAMVTFVWNRR